LSLKAGEFLYSDRNNGKKPSSLWYMIKRPNQSSDCFLPAPPTRSLYFHFLTKLLLKEMKLHLVSFDIEEGTKVQAKGIENLFNEIIAENFQIR
jgi:hypothetical protein